MKIMISACLLGINCKYDGKNNEKENVKNLLKNHTIIPFCPEEMGGLTTPRVPSEINSSDGIVYSKLGVNVNDQFLIGAQKTLEIAIKEQPDLIILKRRSPSCGVHKVYDGTFSGNLIDGSGITAKLLMDNNFKCIEPDEIDFI